MKRFIILASFLLAGICLSEAKAEVQPVTMPNGDLYWHHGSKIRAGWRYYDSGPTVINGVSQKRRRCDGPGDDCYLYDFTVHIEDTKSHWVNPDSYIDCYCEFIELIKTNFPDLLDDQYSNNLLLKDGVIDDKFIKDNPIVDFKITVKCPANSH